MDRSLPETKRLRRDVEWALQRALDPGTVLPMLHRLSRLADVGSDEGVYAQRRLAELLADHHPWRAALCARRVLSVQPRDDGAWAILAMCHALLGNHRCAVAAYRRALDLSPENAAYAHNLGHLLDIALGRPADALSWLRSAYARTHGRTDVAVSLAHALGRAGALAEATKVSRRALRAADTSCLREHVAIAEWLAAGAQAEPKLSPRRPPSRAARAPWKRVDAARPAPPEPGDVVDLDSLLKKGLVNLPLDAKQRERARGLARDPAVESTLPSDAATRASVAAAIAYAIVFVDRVPLTQAEVAASFRVSVHALRGQLKALRARIELSTSQACAAVVRPR
jgi:tetratricopeptide (TPR) repeat protein